MQSPLEDANFGKSIDQVVVMSAADMVTFSRPNDSDPTTKMATLRTNGSAAATCGRKNRPTPVDDEPRRMGERRQAMAEPLAPLSAAHLPQRAPKSEHEPMNFGQPLAAQYLGSKAALARSEKVEETDKYVEKALTGLVVAGASEEEFLKIQRQQLSGIESARINGDGFARDSVQEDTIAHGDQGQGFGCMAAKAKGKSGGKLNEQKREEMEGSTVAPNKNASLSLGIRLWVINANGSGSGNGSRSRCGSGSGSGGATCQQGEAETENAPVTISVIIQDGGGDGDRHGKGISDGEMNQAAVVSVPVDSPVSDVLTKIAGARADELNALAAKSSRYIVEIETPGGARTILRQASSSSSSSSSTALTLRSCGVGPGAVVGLSIGQREERGRGTMAGLLLMGGMKPSLKSSSTSGRVTRKRSAFDKTARRDSMLGQEVVKEGYLDKQSTGMLRKLSSPWQRRYFVLSGHYLKYYENKEASSNSDEASLMKGTIDVHKISEMDAAGEGGIITIVMSDAGSNEIKLRHPSETRDSADVWVKAIRFELKDGREHDRVLKRYTDDRAFVYSPQLNGDKIMLAEDYKGNHEDVYEKYGYAQTDIHFSKLGRNPDDIPIQGFCHKDTTDFKSVYDQLGSPYNEGYGMDQSVKDQYESLGIVIKGKISEDWWYGRAGNAAKQGKRLEKLQARGEEAIAAAGSVDGDAAVLLDICEKNPHIAAMKAGWPPTSSDLSQAQLDGVTVNSTGQVTELNFINWQLTALPRTMSQLKALTNLQVGWNKLPSTEVDFIIESFPQLTSLGLESLGLTALPSTIGDLKALEYLSASSNELGVLPDSIGELQALTRLWLRHNDLSDAEKARVRAALPNCRTLRF